jgi:hypothetical protein
MGIGAFALPPEHFGFAERYPADVVREIGRELSMNA